MAIPTGRDNNPLCASVLTCPDLTFVSQCNERWWEEETKLPCNDILLMALLTLSQRYKHLSWGLQYRPCGWLNFAWSLSPSAKPSDKPASVVISSVIYISEWLLIHFNHVYSSIWYLFYLVTYLHLNSCTPSAELCPLLTLSLPERRAPGYQLPMFVQVGDLACYPAAQLRWWNNVNHLWPFWGCKVRWYTFAKCLYEIKEWAGEV